MTVVNTRHCSDWSEFASHVHSLGSDTCDKILVPLFPLPRYCALIASRLPASWAVLQAISIRASHRQGTDKLPFC